MDPLSALSVAGTIVQFIDFGSKLLSRASEVYNSASGLTAESADLLAVTKDLKSATALWSASKPQEDNNGEEEYEEDEDEKALRELSVRFQASSNDMQLLLGKLKTKSQRTMRDSLRVAWGSLRSRNDVESLQRRLDSYRSQIILRISKMMK